jgi:2-polyprenyl-3-methyl-5-hydroxy-6-metoxy-1,4-benzoquinol methylase
MPRPRRGGRRERPVSTDIPYGRSVERGNAVWKRWSDATGVFKREWLLPLIEIETSEETPAFMREPKIPAEDLKRETEELQPWSVPFLLGEAGWTRQNQTSIGNMAFRSHLIGGAVQQIAGDGLANATVLDMATRNGYFAFDLAQRGAKHVHGFDLRPENIRQAEFLRRAYGYENVDFSVLNAFDHDGSQYDIVLNLGLLYHVIEPLRLIQITYDACRQFAVVWTAARLEPFAGFFLRVARQIDRPSLGAAHAELHPTYRAVIEMMRHVGFKNVTEVIGTTTRPNPNYALGSVRCFVGFR